MFGSNKRLLWLAVPAVLALGGISIARANGHGFGCHHGAPASAAEVKTHMTEHVGRLLDTVDATPAQRTAITAIVDRNSPEVFALMTEGRSLRGELKAALLSATLDQKRIAELETQLHALGDRLIDVSTQGLLDVSTALTPAQRAKIADKLAFFEHMTR